ncbi:sodium-dependent neutral amino acid transporter B(0)AT3-like [Lethenteron reissneri]|uniref:sodium-dependent neutral amino acid transporter B(0)AT3-like n=1 Tax=Lethenteron reissneri TaxID=7753 RepID=UPI002AB6463F|nr:sodium-dependent neutral amino acid transporter B(0)AT3-like [Lethenteron reissneri]
MGGPVVDEERPRWDNKVQYILTCVGFAVGLGNVWRFPYLCQTYGGGAFLIPYLIALVVEGIPIFHLELAIGQRLRRGSVGVWNTIHPLLGGVGVASMLVSFLVGLYYNTILAWVMWYFFNSFQEPLPWKHCPLNQNQTGYVSECADSSPVDYFWYRETLNISPSVEESGVPQWWVVLCHVAAWSIVYVCTIRGIETSGKAVYVTATFPYLVIFIFLVRGLTLEGATDGLVYLFTPDLEVLKNPKVWLDASTQIFYSLSLAFGGLIAFSSYNPIRNDCEVDAVTIACINSATSLFASIPIFSILGFKATMAFNGCLDGNILSLVNEFDLPEGNITRASYEADLAALNSTWPGRVDALALRYCDLQDFLNQAASGTGLAFIIFTEAIVNMPGSQVWSVLFFIMLFMLGLSTMFGNIEGIINPLTDLGVIPKSMPKEAVTGVLCLACMLLGLVFTLSSGNYWLTVFDNYAGSVPLLVIAFFEVIGVIYLYGYDRFSSDLKFMTGRKPNYYWMVTWRFISPLLLVVVFVAYIVVQTQTPLTYESWNPKFSDFPQKEQLPYPAWMIFIIVLLVALPCLFIPGVALYRLIRCRWHRSDIPDITTLAGAKGDDEDGSDNLAYMGGDDDDDDKRSEEGGGKIPDKGVKV